MPATRSELAENQATPASDVHTWVIDRCIFCISPSPPRLNSPPTTYSRPTLRGKTTLQTASNEQDILVNKEKVFLKSTQKCGAGTRQAVSGGEMASNTWQSKLNYMRKLDGVHKWEKRWVAKGSMMVAFFPVLYPYVSVTCPRFKCF